MSKILVIEDSQTTAEALRITLTELGYQVEHAPTLAEGIEKLKEGDVATVLLDLMLPDGSGLDVVRRIRKEVPDVPVVVLTGTKEDLESDALLLGVLEFLRKTEIGPDVLSMAVTRAVERSNLKPTYQPVLDRMKAQEDKIDKLSESVRLSKEKEGLT